MNYLNNFVGDVDVNSIDKIAVIDFDGTLTKHQSQSLLLKYLYKNSYLSLIDYIYISIWFILYKFHIVSNPETALKVALKKFINKEYSFIENLASNLFDEYIYNDLYANSHKVSQTLREEGFLPILMSSATSPIIENAARKLGFEHYFSTDLEIKDGLLTGNLTSGALYRKRKNEKLNNYLMIKGIKPKTILVMTDHHSDIPLLEIADIKIPTNPNSKLLKWAKQKNIPVLNLEQNELVQYLKSNSIIK